MRGCYHWYNSLVTLRTEDEIHVSFGVVAADGSSAAVTDVDSWKIGMVVTLAGCWNSDWVSWADWCYN